ncbi:MAG: protein kinase [Candidatus Riflebacteria bacterium]|nr:protein kinase [Candidatus Riflebacteria bacterium]
MGKQSFENVIFSPGEIVGRHYKLISRIGEGGMGCVWKALDINLDRETALKFLQAGAASDEKAVQRFLTEGRVLATLKHRCVVEVYASDVDEKSKLPFLAMELIHGRRLDQMIEDYADKPALVLRHFLELLDGILACHEKNIIHRDLKPGNVLIDKSGQLKIVDFGIAKTSVNQTQVGVALGTPQYMSPEQGLGKPLTGKSDIYSIGILLWEILTGHPPFDIEGEVSNPYIAIMLMHVNDPLPLERLNKHPNAAPFIELLKKMLEKEPEKRPEIPEIKRAINAELSKLDPTNTSTSSKMAALLFGGNYRLDDIIGEGGMGVVHKAWDTSLDRVVAIKILHDEIAREKTEVDRFLLEGKTLASVKHPNVLDIFASSRDAVTGKPFLVMEYLDGTLLSKMKKVLSTSRGLIVPLMLSLCDGLRACHEKGIIHRDLKPNNIMVTGNGTLKIFDFGIAKSAVNLTRPGMTLGTPQYMSPEQCIGARDITSKADMYSVGVIFWELIFGEPPFKPEPGENDAFSVARQQIEATLPMPAINPSDPLFSIMGIVYQLLDKDPAKRPNADDLVTKLENWLSEHPEMDTASAVKHRRKRTTSKQNIQNLVAEATEPGYSPEKHFAIKLLLPCLIFGGIIYFWSLSKKTQIVQPKTDMPNITDVKTSISSSLPAEPVPVTNATFVTSSVPVIESKPVASVVQAASETVPEIVPAVLPVAASQTEPVKAEKPLPVASSVEVSTKIPEPVIAVTSASEVATSASTAPVTEVTPVSSAQATDTTTAVKTAADDIDNPDLGDGVILSLERIPAGSFQIGADKGEKDEKPRHQVTISKALLIGKHEITHAQFKRVVGLPHSSFQAGADLKPVAPISWIGAVLMCNALSEKLGLKKCYTMVGELAVCDFEADGFRLPTESEWEYACRAGSNSEYYWGSSIDQNYGWFKENSKGNVHEVGGKLPNSWGLYDMVGNADEWCNDWYGSYTSESKVDPRGPGSGTDRVLRGGAIVDSGRFFRSAHRDYGNPTSQKYYHGFRVCRLLPRGLTANVPTSELPSDESSRAGEIEILCSIPDAIVKIEGYDKGKVNRPISIQKIGKKLKIEVSAHGYKSKVLYQVVNPGSASKISVSLEKEKSKR